MNRAIVCLYSYLNTDDNDQGRCYGNSKRLLVRKVWAVLLHHDRQGSVGNKEEQEGRAHPLQSAQEELPLVEEKVLLARFVKARVAKAVLVTDILEETQVLFHTVVDIIGTERLMIVVW